MRLALLDTDILSELLKQKSAHVVSHAAAYLAAHGQFALSVLTRYEIVRGLREKGAIAQISRFEAFCQHSLVLPLTDSILDRAADLWVVASRQGHPRSDADLFIAATALEHGRLLVSGNTSHFAWVPALDTEDRRLP